MKARAREAARSLPLDVRLVAALRLRLAFLELKRDADRSVHIHASGVSPKLGRRSRASASGRLVEAAGFASFFAMLRFVLVPACFLLANAFAWAEGPSFDCAKAKAPDEIAICADEQLSQLDRLAALAYDEARHASGRSSARAAARDGLAAEPLRG